MVSFLDRIYRPKPAPPGFGNGVVNPEHSANWISKITMGWLTPLVRVGYSRPLQEDDLWTLHPKHLSAFVSEKVEARFYARKAAEDSVSSTQSDPESLVNLEKGKAKDDTTPAAEAGKTPVKEKVDSKLAASLNSAFFWSIWPAGLLHLVAQVLRTTSPLVSKALINFLMQSYYNYNYPQLVPNAPPIGQGIGLAFGLCIMQVVASICDNHYMQMVMTAGLLIRSSVIDNVFRKSLRLSNRARTEHPNGQITNMISKDTVRLETAIALIHSAWIVPIQLIIGIVLLAINLGASAGVGIAVMIGFFPLQGVALGFIFYASKKGMKYSDSRLRIMQEVLHGIRIVKLFANERFYAKKIIGFRIMELKMIRLMGFGLAMLMSSLGFVSTLAATAAFIMYAVSGHELTPDVIFSSMQLFDIVRIPLISLPLVMAGAIDAYISLGRISKLLCAEELPEAEPYDPEAKFAIEVDGDFTWEKPAKKSSEKKAEEEKKAKDEKAKKGKKDKKGKKGKDEGILPTTSEGKTADTDTDTDVSTQQEEQKPFELPGLKLNIPKGSFVAIVGRVGSGKSSLMNGLIGEMKCARGQVKFSDRLAYCPQTSWIMNATLKQNVTWFQDDDARFREIVRACSLEHDLEILPQGENTEIGEKGINISGGQRARISLARAAFSNAPIVLMDDPLSAVDAAVGKALLEHCILSGPLADKTRVLVTHALSVLPHTDYIYVMENGVIAEQGTYAELLTHGGAFAKLVEDYGNKEANKDSQVVKPQAEVETTEAKETEALMATEERLTGQVTLKTYTNYLRAAGGAYWGPVLIFLILAAQAAQVAGQLALSFWTSRSLPGFTDQKYEALYGGLGAAQAVFSFLSCFGFTLAGIRASSSLFGDGLWGVLRAPMSFMEVTPMGRIVARLSADLAKIDNKLAITFFFLFNVGSGVMGVIGLVFYAYPWLGIMFVPLGLLYWFAMSFYRRTSIEVKRIDSILRSTVYSSYTEALTGLSTIRACREQKRFIDRTEAAMDIQNRAGYMTITAQRWLGLRLDMLGNALVLGICLFAVGFRQTVDPSKVGLVLTYTLAITSILSELVSKFAETEQDMNAVERLQEYAALTPEAARTTPEDPPASWPSLGAVSFKGVTMSYRPGLPSILKDVNFDVKPGEKVGIVGRTGAGKSSLLQALFRVVELSSGSIIIDGHDIGKIGLDPLRRQLAVIPQESVLFEGTIRENLDPESTRTDAELITALQHAWLLPQKGIQDPVAEEKFRLDAVVGDEGANFSAGERQLVALTRALVKGSRIIVLDEATSNVDVETDSKLQKTIQTQFSSSTLLCIAHRLNTVAHYDRILAMDNGMVAEFDTPLALFDRPHSIFRSLCDEANLSRAEIVRIRANGGKIDTPLYEAAADPPV